MKVSFASAALTSCVLLFLPACALNPEIYPPDSPPKAGPCRAEPVQYALSKKVSDALGAELKEQSGAEVLRWIPVGSAITMDYRVERLNIHYGRDMRITKIDCG